MVHTFVVDFNLDLNLARDRTKSSELALFVVIMTGIKLGIFIWQLNGGDE